MTRKKVHPNVTVIEKRSGIVVIVRKYGWKGRITIPRAARIDRPR